MSGGIPYIGSKISLISKAGIRYEGILYSINTAESNVTLANVRSLGTEERDAEVKIPERDEVYEYIIFRGKDIKDIHVCEPPKPPPQDPAILESSQPRQVVRTEPHHQCQGQVPSQASYGPQFSPFNNVYSQYNRSNAAMSGQMPGAPQGQQPPQMQGQQQGHPVVFPPGMQPQQQVPLQHSAGDEAVIQHTYRKRDGSRGSTPTQGRGSPQDQAESHQRADEREHVDERDQQQVQQQQQQQRRRQDFHRPRGRGGNRGAVNRGRGRRGAPQHGGRPRNEPLTFKDDFDFEAANAHFDKEELEKEMKQMSLNEKVMNSASDDKAVNGENKDGAVSGESEEEEEIEATYYDKSKSFFDKISCEASQRFRGGHSRPNWREERKINSETFGISSTKEINRHRYGRGGMRGRGFPPGFRGNRGRGRGGRPPSGSRGGRRGWEYHGYQNRPNTGTESQRRQPREQESMANREAVAAK